MVRSLEWGSLVYLQSTNDICLSNTSNKEQPIAAKRDEEKQLVLSPARDPVSRLLRMDEGIGE